MKRILASLCAFLLVLSMGVTAAASGIVVFGDSISTGYGLDGYEASDNPYTDGSYVQLLADELGNDVTNYAIDGLTSGGLLKKLNALSDGEKATLEDADVVIVYIGGNDLLQLLFGEIGKAFEVDMQSPDASVQLTERLSGILSSPDVQTLTKIKGMFAAIETGLPAVIGQYATNLDGILAAVVEGNPDATVIMPTLYNPYADVDVAALAQLGDKTMGLLNAEIFKAAKKYGVTVADVDAMFRWVENGMEGEGLTNATDPETPFDPHPTAYGHEVIALGIYIAMEYDDVSRHIAHWEFQEFTNIMVLVASGISDIDEAMTYLCDVDATYADLFELIDAMVENDETRGTLPRLTPTLGDAQTASLTRGELFDVMGRIYAVALKLDEEAVAVYAGEVAESDDVYVQLLIRDGVVIGYPDKTMRLEQTATKAEVLQTLTNLFKAIYSRTQGVYS